ncbi:MAG: FkbM family methyltransferase [Bacteroidales bacterium]
MSKGKQILKVAEKIAAFFGYKYIRYGLPYRFACKKHKKEIDLVESILEDKLSKQILYAAIRCRKTKNKKYLKPFFDQSEHIEEKYASGHLLRVNPVQYFAKDIVALSEEEVFVDGGGYLGDTALQFVKACNGKFKKIHVFEPIQRQQIIIQQNLSQFAEKIIVHPAGLSSITRKVVFADTASSSRKTTSTGQMVQLVALDTHLSEKERAEITYIKLDIEGEELLALQGMKDTIVNYKPKLAICIYHRPEDLWEIPLYIHTLNPAYCFYIRQHNVYNETVLYAIPKTKD